MKDVSRRGSYRWYWVGERFMAIYIRMAFQYVEKDLLFQIRLDSASHRHIFLSLVDPSHNPAILHTF